MTTNDPFGGKMPPLTGQIVPAASQAMSPFGSTMPPSEIAPATPATGLTRRSGKAIARSVGRVQGDAVVALAKEQAQAMIATAHERGRARVANEALMNVAELSSLEEHLIKIAPLGMSRYQHIVDNYALGASFAVLRYGR